MADLVVNLDEPESVRRVAEQLDDQILQVRKREEQAIDAARRAAGNVELVQAERQRLELKYESVLGLARALDVDLDQHDDFEPVMLEEDDLSSKDRAFQVVTAINGPTNVAEVAEQMPDFRRKTVSWALWTLANKDKTIQNIGHGRYAPLGWQEGKPTTNYLKIPKAFNVPSQNALSAAMKEAADQLAANVAEGQLGLSEKAS